MGSCGTVSGVQSVTGGVLPRFLGKYLRRIWRDVQCTMQAMEAPFRAPRSKPGLSLSTISIQSSSFLIRSILEYYTPNFHGLYFEFRTGWTPQDQVDFHTYVWWEEKPSGGREHRTGSCALILR